MPENREFKPLRVDLREQAVLIEGVVVGVLRLAGESPAAVRASA
jgi:SOS-response transcriptional repressor LexA